MSMLATVSGVALPVAWLTTNPAMAMTPPITPQPPPTTTVVAAGSVLRRARVRSETPRLSAFLRSGRNSVSNANRIQDHGHAPTPAYAIA